MPSKLFDTRINIIITPNLALKVQRGYSFIMSQKGPNLALDSAAFGEAQGLRRGENIIDSLAYIDTISNAEKIAAENLIKEEVRLLESAAKDQAHFLLKNPLSQRMPYMLRTGNTN